MTAAKKATPKRPGLYANIHAKQERIEHGSGEHMRKPGSDGAPTEAAFRAAAKTEKAAKSTKTTKSTTTRKAGAARKTTRRAER